MLLFYSFYAWFIRYRYGSFPKSFYHSLATIWTEQQAKNIVVSTPKQNRWETKINTKCLFTTAADAGAVQPLFKPENLRLMKNELYTILIPSMLPQSMRKMCFFFVFRRQNPTNLKEEYLWLIAYNHNGYRNTTFKSDGFFCQKFQYFTMSAHR